MTKRTIKAKLLEMLADHVMRGWDGLRMFEIDSGDKARRVHRTRVSGVALDLSMDLSKRAEKLFENEARYQERRRA